MTRGFIKSNVEKHISQDTVVIVDSMNYIKGYRYELYCLARSAKTTNCTLYLNTSYEKCKEWNSIGKSNFDDILYIYIYKNSIK
jgi:protein KTI12